MKFLISAMLVFLSVKSNAETSNCKEQYATLFRLAAENTWYSKVEVTNRKAIALAYDKAGYGPGPGRFSQQNFLAALDQKSARDLVGLYQDQMTLQNLLKNSAKCFPGLSQDEISNTYQMLTK